MDLCCFGFFFPSCTIKVGFSFILQWPNRSSWYTLHTGVKPAFWFKKSGFQIGMLFFPILEQCVYTWKCSRIMQIQFKCYCCLSISTIANKEKIWYSPKSHQHGHAKKLSLLKLLLNRLSNYIWLVLYSS